MEREGVSEGIKDGEELGWIESDGIELTLGCCDGCVLSVGC